VSQRWNAAGALGLYANHAEMDADRLRWTVEAIVERARRD
jgi:hypothetical protein